MHSIFIYIRFLAYFLCSFKVIDFKRAIKQAYWCSVKRNFIKTNALSITRPSTYIKCSLSVKELLVFINNFISSHDTITALKESSKALVYYDYPNISHEILRTFVRHWYTVPSMIKFHFRVATTIHNNDKICLYLKILESYFWLKINLYIFYKSLFILPFWE